jgi:hypothetical protein
MVATRGHIVQTPTKDEPYKVVLEHEEGPDTEETVSSIRDGRRADQERNAYSPGTRHNVRSAAVQRHEVSCPDIAAEPVLTFDRDEGLETLGEVVVHGGLENAWKVGHPHSGSFFQPIAICESLPGPRPNYVAGDEIQRTDRRERASDVEAWHP